ncbi:hypothetical protein [Paenibacillus sp. FSL H8-0079]|uniref:hypothetical protein n=1 Tax=Paenibacillus sp. FSL H8-0079 TaxID=2921375 RepID=UPI0030EBCA78
MTSLWGDFGNLDSYVTPKSLLDEQAKHLTILTKGRLYGEVEVINQEDLSDNNNNFTFELQIKSEFLPNYQFTILDISHNIIPYPLELRIEGNIWEELGYGPSNYGYYQIDHEDEFKKELEKILSSNAVKNVVKALYNMTK